MKEKVEKKQNLEQLIKKNHNQKIIIIILVILLLGSLVLQVPSVRKQAINIIKGEQVEEKVDYNSKYKLNLVSTYGDVEAYHPKILSFDNKWNGYYYWMSYTPYPDSDEQKENPHIVASNDMINWEVPNGLANPLDDVKGDNSKQYNSDAHLTFNNDLNRLECYWRYVDDDSNKAIIYRKWTTDGVNWSEKEEAAVSNNRQEKDYVSPAILYEDGIYKIWYVDKENTIRYAEATLETQWKDIKTISLEYPKSLKAWHLDIIKTDTGYEMLLMAYTSVSERGKASLYYTSSVDNNTWTKCKEIIKPTSETDYWDNRGIYRSSMIKKDGIYYVFYSASNKDNIKGIGIMYGKNINKLKSVDIDYTNDKDAVKKFEKLIKKESK